MTLFKFYTRTTTANRFRQPALPDIIPCLKLNGTTMQASHSCSVVFNPCLPDEINNEPEAKWVLKHYELDTSYGWMIF